MKLETYELETYETYENETYETYVKLETCITALAFETTLKQNGSLLVADGVSLYSIKVCNARLLDLHLHHSRLPTPKPVPTTSFH